MTPSSDPKVERALRSSHTEGALAQIAGGVYDHYLVPCALFLGAGPAAAGWLAAAPRLLSALAQAGSPAAARWTGDRRRLLVWGAALQGLALLPIALAVLRPGPRALAAVFAAALLFQLLGGFMYPAWASLMSEYLPSRRRAGYFGRRNRCLFLWGLLALAFWGLVLDASGPLRCGAAFAALFAFGAACRLVSTPWMGMLAARPLKDPPTRQAAWWRASLDDELGRLVLYAACGSFASQLCDSMQPVRLLSGLHCGYRAFMLVRLAGVLGGAAAAARWGRRADRRGPAATLRWAGLLTVLSPVVWALTRKVRLIGAVELFDGAAGAGFSLCAANHLYDIIPEEGRMQAIGTFTLATGVALFAGAGLAGTLAQAGLALPALFAAAAALRLGVEISLGPRVAGLDLGGSPASDPGVAQAFLTGSSGATR